MRFEEVREMEESPMDEDVLEELCFPYSAASMQCLSCAITRNMTNGMGRI